MCVTKHADKIIFGRHHFVTSSREIVVHKSGLSFFPQSEDVNNAVVEIQFHRVRKCHSPKTPQAAFVTSTTQINEVIPKPSFRNSNWTIYFWVSSGYRSIYCLLLHRKHRRRHRWSCWPTAPNQERERPRRVTRRSIWRETGRFWRWGREWQHIFEGLSA